MGKANLLAEQRYFESKTYAEEYPTSEIKKKNVEVLQPLIIPGTKMGDYIKGLTKIYFDEIGHEGLDAFLISQGHKDAKDYPWERTDKELKTLFIQGIVRNIPEDVALTPETGEKWIRVYVEKFLYQYILPMIDIDKTA